MLVRIRWENKKRLVEWPCFFKKQGFIVAYTKKQFDYFREADITKNIVFYDYNKQIIYIHEWQDAVIKDDCDYAWPTVYNHYIKVFERIS